MGEEKAGIRGGGRVAAAARKGILAASDAVASLRPRENTKARLIFAA
jgi:hypothetical protein